MPKMVLVGAGSFHFARNFIMDVLMFPELRDSTIALVDIDKERLELTTAFARKLVKQHGLKTRIESTTDRREVLKDADYVIVAIKVGGARLGQLDHKVTWKYGVEWDDTLGPCGVFYGHRHIQAILEICRDMEELCPNAWLLNYSNPQAMICWAISDYTKIKNVGLCPNQRNLAEDLARNAGVPFNEVSYWLAGINHFAFYLELTWRGQDLYPKFREKYKEKVYSGIDAGWLYENPPGKRVGIDLVEVEMFKKFGYFTTGSSGHISKYVPYFMRTDKQKATYKLGGETGSVSGLKFDNSKRKAEEDELKRQLAGDYKLPLTDEYRWTIFAVNIIDSIATGKVRRLNCNVKNDGLITNISQGCCVEVPCMVDKEGIHPCHIGDLPAQCAALIQPNIHVQELAVRGSVEKDKNKLFQSILLDPLTASICTIDEMQQMFEEMCEEEKEYLKGFK